MGKAPDNRWRQKVDEMKVTEQERQMLEVLREWNDWSAPFGVDR
jgi:hypothetical protein